MLVLTMALLIPLIDIIYTVVVNASPAVSLSIFTETTVNGGLINAIAGSLFLVALSTVFSVALGVFSGIYLAEFGGRFADFVRFFADVLTGVPSIVVGFFGFIVFVLYLGWGFSALAGSVALTIIMLPYITRTTEFALRKVPAEMKEGSFALGASKAATVNKISLRYAAPGIITGILIAISISIGETAPLLYTADFSNYIPSGALTHSAVGYLTYVIWAFINEPFTLAHEQAYVASLLLLLIVFASGLVARALVNRWWKS
jgi:phosphate transport system permease protein